MIIKVGGVPYDTRYMTLLAEHEFVDGRFKLGAVFMRNSYKRSVWVTLSGQYFTGLEWRDGRESGMEITKEKANSIIAELTVTASRPERFTDKFESEIKQDYTKRL